MGFTYEIADIVLLASQASTGLVVGLLSLKKELVVKTGFHLNAKIYCSNKGKAPQGADST